MRRDTRAHCLDEHWRDEHCRLRCQLWPRRARDWLRCVKSANPRGHLATKARLCLAENDVKGFAEYGCDARLVCWFGVYQYAMSSAG